MGARTKRKRYRLDVSSQFYPIIATRKSQSLFGMAAHMDAPVDREILALAVGDVLKRFPTFAVKLRKGYSWYYFEENTAQYPVGEPSGRPLRPIGNKEKAGYLFRLDCKDDVVVFEVFHAVCDGLAALEFLKAVLYAYALRSGRRPEGSAGVADLAATPSDEEAEDAFYRYHTRIKLGDVQLKELMGARPVLLDGTPLEEGCAVSYGGVLAEDVRVAAKAHGVSVTAFLCGVTACAVHRTQSRRDRDIVIMVPVNLRNMFPSCTMRNFVNFVRLVFRRGECEELSDFVASAARQLKEKATPEEMAKFMSTTVSTERSLVLAAAPLWLKIFAARIVRALIKSRQTLIFSNLGRIEFPAGAGVRRIVFNLNVSKTSRVNVGALTLNGETTLAFSRSVRERVLEDGMFEILREAGAEAVCRSDSVSKADKNATLTSKTMPIKEAL